MCYWHRCHVHTKFIVCPTTSDLNSITNNKKSRNRPTKEMKYRAEEVVVAGVGHHPSSPPQSSKSASRHCRNRDLVYHCRHHKTLVASVAILSRPPSWIRRHESRWFLRVPSTACDASASRPPPTSQAPSPIVASTR